MARIDTLGNFLTDVANAIREKGGTSDPIQASSFDTAIANLPSGGGSGVQLFYADTLAHLNNLSGIKDGDYGVVYNIILGEISKHDQIQGISFPKSFTVDEAFQDEFHYSFGSTNIYANGADGNTYPIDENGSLSITYSNNELTIQVGDSFYQQLFVYTASQDGLTFNLTDGEAGDYYFRTPYIYDSFMDTSEVLGLDPRITDNFKRIDIGRYEFYIRQNNQWVYLNNTFLFAGNRVEVKNNVNIMAKSDAPFGLTPDISGQTICIYPDYQRPLTINPRFGESDGSGNITLYSGSMLLSITDTGGNEYNVPETNIMLHMTDINDGYNCYLEIQPPEELATAIENNGHSLTGFVYDLTIADGLFDNGGFKVDTASMSEEWM